MELRGNLNAFVCVTAVQVIAANVDNNKLSDAEFRQFVLNSLKVAQKDSVPKLARAPSALLSVACPRCNAEAGVDCRYPNGGLRPPHWDRHHAWQDKQ